MVLFKEKVESNIKKLVQVLNTYKDEEKRVCIHLIFDDGKISNCVILEEIEISNQVVYLTGDDFVVNLNKKIEKIDFSDYEESACIVFDQGKIYLDFVNSW